MEEIVKDWKRDFLYRRWVSPTAKAALLLVHGLGAHSARWDFLADYFRANSISSYAMELRGFGETKGLKGHVDSFGIYIDDILRLHEIIKEENPSRDVFLAGESMGALISILAVSKYPGLFKGLICISPVFSSTLKIPVSDRIKIFLSLLFNPKRQFSMLFTSEMCTRDKAYQISMDNDPREYRSASSKLLFSIILAQGQSKACVCNIDIPVIFVTAGSDAIANNKVTDRIFTKIKEKDKTKIDYPMAHHALSVDMEREKVFSDIFKWMQERIKG